VSTPTITRADTHIIIRDESTYLSLPYTQAVQGGLRAIPWIGGRYGYFSSMGVRRVQSDMNRRMFQAVLYGPPIARKKVRRAYGR
jgi:hypothetical protein